MIGKPNNSVRFGVTLELLLDNLTRAFLLGELDNTSMDPGAFGMEGVKKKVSSPTGHVWFTRENVYP